MLKERWKEEKKSLEKFRDMAKLTMAWEKQLRFIFSSGLRGPRSRPASGAGSPPVGSLQLRWWRRLYISWITNLQFNGCEGTLNLNYVLFQALLSFFPPFRAFMIIFWRRQSWTSVRWPVEVNQPLQPTLQPGLRILQHHSSFDWRHSSAEIILAECWQILATP